MTEYIPILSRSGLWLWNFDTSDEVARRFAAMFAATWKKIPLSVRRRLLAYWRAAKYSGMLRTDRWPVIELTNNPRVFRQGNCPSPDRAAGQASTFGGSLTFAGWLATRPQIEVESVIAHELAHLFLLSQDAVHASECGTPATYRTAPGEIAADRLAESWGFYQPRLHRQEKRRGLAGSVQ